MKLHLLLFALLGFLAGTVFPSIASTSVHETFEITRGQRKLIGDFDVAFGTKFLPIAETPAAVPFLKTALLACDHIPLQRQVVAAAGGSEAEIQYALDRFNRDFCGKC